MKKLIAGLRKYRWVLAVYLLAISVVVCLEVAPIRDALFFPEIDKIDNDQAQDVNFVELKYFLDNCQTIQGDPDRGCAEYAQDLHNEAEAQGIRCAVVIIPMGDFPHIGFHAINGFETTDNGMVYVDAGLGYAYEPRLYGIAEKGTDGVYRIEMYVGEVELWHGSYKTIEPKYDSETLGKERMFWVCW